MAPLDEPATDTSSGGYGYSEDEEDSYGWRTPPKQSRPTDMLRRARAYAVQQPKQLLAVAVAVFVLLLLWWSSLPPPDPWRRDHKWEVGLRPPPAPQSRLATTGQGRRGERRVAGVAEVSFGSGSA